VNVNITLEVGFMR